MMRAIFLSILTISQILYSCGQKDDAAQIEMKREFNFKKIENDEEFFPTGGGLAFANREQHESMVERVHKSANIVTPSGNAKINQEMVKDAVSDYKSFVSEHSQDTLMTKYFKHKYAGVLLREYEVVNSNDVELCSMLVWDLIASQYGSYDTILEGLEKLKSKIEEGRFRKMVDETNKQIAKSLELHKIAQQRLPGLIKGMEDGSLEIKGNLRKDFVVALTKEDDFSENMMKLEAYHLRVQAL